MLPRRLKKLNDVASKRQKGLVLVLEDIHDPHNAEAVFRTCDAFGIQKIYLIFEKEKYFNPRRVGRVSSASANKWLDFEISRSTEKCLKKLKREGYSIIAAALEDDAENIFKMKFSLSSGKKKIALLMGNEHRGLSDKALKLSSKKVMIPMRGFVQSLNLSVTTALFLFEILRQRKFHPVLQKGEVKKLVNDFKKR